MVVASVAEAEYAAAFGGGQVLVELTLTLTKLGRPQKSTLSCLSTTSVRLVLRLLRLGRRSPSQSTCVSIGLKRASQQFFCLVFLPGLINPTVFFTKTLPIYCHLAALPFLHGTPYPISFPPVRIWVLRVNYPVRYSSTSSRHATVLL